jgi:hypothetical protein
MSRSSILNFESLDGFTMRVPATLLAVLGAVVALEVCFRLIPEKKLVPKVSRQGEIFFMEKEVLSKFNAPEIVFLGSSRIRRAIIPAKLDEQLGKAKGSTINLGLAMARPYESLYLYERNETALKSAKLVVFNVDEWFVSSGPKMSNSLYETHGPLVERLYFPERMRTRLFLDGLLTMKLVPGAVFGRKNDVQNLKLDANNQVVPPPGEGKLEAYGDHVAMFYDRFDINAVMLGHIEKLAEKVKANGGRFVLLQLPNRAAYQIEVEKTHRAEYDRERAALETLAAKLSVPLWAYRLPEEIGLNDDDYEDYGHMTPGGAAKTTKFIGDKIRELNRMN